MRTNADLTRSPVVIVNPAPCPPPSPAPSNTMLVSSFPFGSGCILGRNATQSPVRLSAPLGPMSVTSSTATYCLLISSNAALVSPTAECAGMDTVRRVDMVVDPTCAQQKPKPITAVTVNGRVPQHILQTIDFNGVEYGVLTIKRIDALFQSLPDDGLSVCLTFNKGFRVLGKGVTRDAQIGICVVTFPPHLAMDVLGHYFEHRSHPTSRQSAGLSITP
ncbi:hypothetical protein VOLCADRAFT_100727 [Volvox carteri f. nagariensis]|uniref:Pherophorin domain-containing protein n=1 Tax=Volvox carteri f. nagariensis TaxID=3068 RepID=D8UKW0_VOLCA|nr:uncharacterized protein VOLCADRAFT_100727 [Volvox carteri f. nagariensis]EFJ39640.1 hypothetical protein VOLCADRAFT_100727 [Volvox carteri f. nagariensis]|eukprot:XP_002959299.1 hypothetical protein VOLCADRAFT_100727 [Volvox carteri f. nagariensis]